jgi:hypothetical protein
VTRASFGRASHISAGLRRPWKRCGSARSYSCAPAVHHWPEESLPYTTTDACIPACRSRDPVAAIPLSEDCSISKVPFGARYSGAWVQMRSNGARPPRRVPPPRAEERYEFDRPHDQFSPTRLRGFAAAVCTARATAPTRPRESAFTQRPTTAHSGLPQASTALREPREPKRGASVLEHLTIPCDLLPASLQVGGSPIDSFRRGRTPRPYAGGNPSTHVSRLRRPEGSQLRRTCRPASPAGRATPPIKHITVPDHDRVARLGARASLRSPPRASRGPPCSARPTCRGS